MTDFNFGDLVMPDDPVDTIGGWLDILSQHCDVFVYEGARRTSGVAITNLPDSCRVVENKGYFEPGFFMANPFYYLDRMDVTDATLIKNGVVFIKIPGGKENLDDFQLPCNFEIASETFASVPVVLFRRRMKFLEAGGQVRDMGVDGSIDDCAEPDDFSILGQCVPLWEFIGVFKTEHKGESDGKAVYKMTKVLDRYYFDDTKIK